MVQENFRFSQVNIWGEIYRGEQGLPFPISIFQPRSQQYPEEITRALSHKFAYALLNPELDIDIPHTKSYERFWGTIDMVVESGKEYYLRHGYFPSSYLVVVGGMEYYARLAPQIQEKKMLLNKTAEIQQLAERQIDVLQHLQKSSLSENKSRLRRIK